VEHAKKRDLEMVLLETAEEAMTRRGRLAEGLILSERPELIDLFFTYQNEAIAARKFLDSNLNKLNSGAQILEVGGGILALAVQLASEGFTVTTVEPVGEGFTGISFIMDVFIEIAKDENLVFNVIQSPIEDCEFDHKFDFIFSINVMEHLKNPYPVILQMVSTLENGGKYRFFCPNYDFPYEPHFGKWLFLRKNKAFYLQGGRANSNSIPLDEALGLHRSLNYITLNKISKYSHLKQIKIIPKRKAFFSLLERAVHDKGLSARHGVLTSIVKLIYLFKFHHIAKLVPARYQPVMDVEAYSLDK
jgi:2-polyprenyl-3-methyl-5-hydroxy-6-metoxy-1,4-benzoquinol methylase